jgi:hypothetical protein
MISGRLEDVRDPCRRRAALQELKGKLDKTKRIDEFLDGVGSGDSRV